MRQPTNPFHPGEILAEEFLNPAGITQTAFAEKIGWTRARLNELINGKRGITADAALDLAEAMTPGRAGGLSLLAPQRGRFMSRLKAADPLLGLLGRPNQIQLL